LSKQSNAAQQSIANFAANWLNSLTGRFSAISGNAQSYQSLTVVSQPCRTH